MPSTDKQIADLRYYQGQSEHGLKEEIKRLKTEIDSLKRQRAAPVAAVPARPKVELDEHGEPTKAWADAMRKSQAPATLADVMASADGLGEQIAGLAKALTEQLVDLKARCNRIEE